LTEKIISFNTKHCPVRQATRGELYDVGLTFAMTKGESLDPPCRRRPYGGPPDTWNASRWLDISAAHAIAVSPASAATAAAGKVTDASFTPRDTKLRRSKEFRGRRRAAGAEQNWRSRN